MVEIGKKCVCPLLRSPNAYNPDTIDLVNNIEERNYWLDCLDHMVKKFAQKASTLNPNFPCAAEKAEICYQKFHKLTRQLKANPTSILNPLSVRTLLEYNENCLRENNFKDAWLLQKEKESMQAFKEFSDRIAETDKLSNFRRKWVELVRGVLAGNVFDWGSSSVSNILESTKNFGLANALNTIQERPWFHDDLDKWIDRLEREPYKKTVIFVDNAGVDFVLGILPFVREMLMQGTKVVLSANSYPALNDMTYRELNLYCCIAAQKCDVLKKSIENGKLVTMENGQKGPCLDLTDLPADLCNTMTDADLIILEGMGRAIHTNLYADFTVDSIKLAVLKNEWLAHSLGAEQFSVIFKYEAKT